MSKLIAAHAANPTPENRVKLRAYLVKHPMAVVTATLEELAYLRENQFIA